VETGICLESSSGCSAGENHGCPARVGDRIWSGCLGLLSHERIAEHAEKLIGIESEVYGFDTGCGMPKPQAYRDCPNLWLDRQFPMDQGALKALVRYASLQFGEVKDTVPAFLEKPRVPVAFISTDLDYYSSTKEALKLLNCHTQPIANGND